MKYQHIIWDWNGTLLDDAWLCVEIMNAQLLAAGLPEMSPARYAEVFRFPVIDYYREIGFDFEQTPFETWSDAFIEVYERRKLECPVRPEGIAHLKYNFENGLPQSIISASKETSLHEIVRQYGLFNLFTAVRGLDDHHAHGKLAIGREWVAELGLPPGEILLVGDTLHDCQMAGELGIDCVLVVSGHQNRARLESCGVPVVDSLAELNLLA